MHVHLNVYALWQYNFHSINVLDFHNPWILLWIYDSLRENPFKFNFVESLPLELLPSLILCMCFFVFFFKYRWSTWYTMFWPLCCLVRQCSLVYTVALFIKFTIILQEIYAILLELNMTWVGCQELYNAFLTLSRIGNRRTKNDPWPFKYAQFMNKTTTVTQRIIGQSYLRH